jgi:hypothetical protein
VVAVDLLRPLKGLFPYRSFVLTTPDAPDLIRWRVEAQKAPRRNVVGHADVQGFKIRRDGLAMTWPPPVAVGRIVASASGRTEVRVVLRLHWSMVVFCGFGVAFGTIMAAGLALSPGVAMSTSLLPAGMGTIFWLGALAQLRSEAGWLEAAVRWCVLGEYCADIPNLATRPPPTPVT